MFLSSRCSKSRDVVLARAEFEVSGSISQRGRFQTGLRQFRKEHQMRLASKLKCRRDISKRNDKCNEEINSTGFYFDYLYTLNFCDTKL